MPLKRYLSCLKIQGGKQQAVPWRTPSVKNPVPMGELSKSGASRGESLIFGYMIRRKRGVRSWKQTKNGGNASFLSTGLFKSGARGLESRQKTGEMPLFCLPDSSNPERAEPKVEQNLQKSEKCSTAGSKSGPRDLESRTKSRKIEKMFYLVTLAKHFGLRLRSNLKNWRFARNRGVMPV